MNVQKMSRLLSKAKEAYKIVSISTIEHVGWDETLRDVSAFEFGAERGRDKIYM